MLLRKAISLSNVDLKMEGDTGRFAGYASVFGGTDDAGDTIVRGAFASTLRTHGLPKMYLEHAWAKGAHGSAMLPIGKFHVAKEDDHGLFVEGELTPGMSVSSDVRAAMKHGTIDGLSIGGLIKKGDYEEIETGRVIKRWSRLIEVSVVAHPADTAARVDPSTVKSELLDEIEEIGTIREFERFLRDAGGLTKGAATALAARAKKIFGIAGEPDPKELEAKQLAEIEARLARLSALAG